MSDRPWTAWRQCARRYIVRNGDIIPIIVDDDGVEHEVVWAPMPGSQAVFLECAEIETLLEGNRGGGKTDTLIMDFVQHVGQGYEGEWVGVCFRQTKPMLRDLIEKCRKWFKRLHPDAVYNENKYFWQFGTGERLYLSHFEQASDFDSYIGHSYAWIGWEELVRWQTPDFYKQMFSCLRSAKYNMPRKVRATTNPYGVGHTWVQTRFGLWDWPKFNADGKWDGTILGPLIEGEVDPVTRLKEPNRRTIHNDLSENQVMKFSDPNYIANIRAAARNESELKAWVYGSWDITAGGMFDDIWAACKGIIVQPDFIVPDYWPMMRALDYGSAKPWSVGFYTKSDGSDVTRPDGSVLSTIRGDYFRVGEVYGSTSKPNEGLRLPPGKITEMVIQYEIGRGWRDRQTGRTRVRQGPADTGIFDDTDGRPSIAMDMEKSVTIGGITYRGLQWLEADKGPGSRIQGWEQMRKRLAAVKRPDSGYREIPGLFICASCKHWIRTVPKLSRDEKNLDDVNDEEEDHCADETRYALRFDWGSYRSGRVTGV